MGAYKCTQFPLLHDGLASPHRSILRLSLMFIYLKFLLIIQVLERKATSSLKLVELGRPRQDVNLESRVPVSIQGMDLTIIPR